MKKKSKALEQSVWWCCWGFLSLDSFYLFTEAPDEKFYIDFFSLFDTTSLFHD